MGRSMNYLRCDKCNSELSRCEDCNNELSCCGVPDEDGVPAMDCEPCQLRDRIRSLETVIEKLRDVIASGVRETVMYQREIAAKQSNG